MKPKSIAKKSSNPTANVSGTALKVPSPIDNLVTNKSIPPIVHQNADVSSLNGTTLTTTAYF